MLQAVQLCMMIMLLDDVAGHDGDMQLGQTFERQAPVV